MSRKNLALLLAGLFLLLGGCAPAPEGSQPPESLSAQASQTSTPETPELPVSESPLPETRPPEPSEPQLLQQISVTSTKEIQEALRAAMEEVRQPPVMELSGFSLENPEMDVRNLYYGITGQHRELVYAYDISAQVEGDLLTCTLSYMPYKTGDHPDESALSVASLRELVDAAQSRLREEPLPVRITDPTLLVDDMNCALQQAGDGYILCALNRDGTAITFNPAMGMTIAECLDFVEEAQTLAAQVAQEVITENMTQREKAEAFYIYLTAQVQYDRLYYTDKTSMPYHSQTALGALRDDTAICGGYSHAMKLLLEQEGIFCFNMTGKCYSEDHMWNLARLDGQWLFLDATADRGVKPEIGFKYFALEELPEQYNWDSAQIDPLLAGY